MKMEKLWAVVIFLSLVATINAVPFDGKSDVNIIDHTGETDFGNSMASAGDLNNDGYVDLVIGAHSNKKAFVYFGGPSFDNISDVNITDHTGETFFAYSLDSAGDLNNDGYADLVVGATNTHKAWVYYGGPSFDGTSDVTIDDHTTETDFGWILTNAGKDLNDDGYADLVIGAFGAKKAFVYYGGPSFDNISDVDITDHTAEGLFGTGLASDGDLNNDGHADLVISSPTTKKAFVYYGGPSFDGTSDLTIDDHTGEANFGYSLASASDLNNDGYADLAIGTSTEKKVWLYYGGPGFDNVSDVTIDDHLSDAQFGTRATSGGDLNDDGYADLVVGAPSAKKAFVYYGVDYPLKYLAQPTIVTLQGKISNSTSDSGISTGSLNVTIKDSHGSLVWTKAFNDVLDDGVFNTLLGAVQELRLIPGNTYEMEVAVDADSATYTTADVTFGDSSPSGDIIKFVA